MSDSGVDAHENEKDEKFHGFSGNFSEAEATNTKLDEKAHENGPETMGNVEGTSKKYRIS